LFIFRILNLPDSGFELFTACFVLRVATLHCLFCFQVWNTSLLFWVSGSGTLPGCSVLRAATLHCLFWFQGPELFPGCSVFKDCNSS
jgi:hypothetical protein